MKKIDKIQIVEAVKRSNPWWKDETTFNLFDNLPRRTHFSRILELICQRDPRRALVLMGPRRVGKTVILYQAIGELIRMGTNKKKILFASLDNPLFRLSSLEEVLIWGLEATNTEIIESFVFFDEVQYLENWEQQLKVLVDTYPQVKFVVTGSATAALHKKSKESGAGRFTDYMLPPLSFYEYMSLKNEMEKTPEHSIDLEQLNSQYIDYLNFGGFPESFTSKNLRDFPEQYIGQDILDKVLMRDLPSVFGITNPNELNRLFTALAYNSANEISLESITQTSGVSKNDIYRYIEYLEAAFLVKTIDKTDNKTQQFKRRTFFKVILSNPSLRSAIFGKVKESDPELEGLAETAVFSQLVIHFWQFDLYKYARWNKGNSKGEVDLVHVNRNGTPIAAMEIKWTDRFARGDETPKSLVNYCKENGLKEGYATSRTLFAKTTHDGITVHHIPTAFICFVLGYQLSLGEAATRIAPLIFEKLKNSTEMSVFDQKHLQWFERVAKDISCLHPTLTARFADGYSVATAILK